MFVYELSDCGFESHCSHLNFRYPILFKEGVPWHFGNCRLWIHSKGVSCKNLRKLLIGQLKINSLQNEFD